MSLLEQNTTTKKYVKKLLKLDVGDKNNKKYKVEGIWDNIIYTRESKNHLSEFYYLVE